MNRMHLGLALLLISSTASSQDQPSEETLASLKKATVYLRISSGPKAVSGSGFLFKKDDTGGFIATNAHVVTGVPGADRKIIAVFSSGTPQESARDASVVGLDTVRDLAILHLESKELPKPIELASREFYEPGLPVFILGFPFGQELATGGKNPAITIAKGAVTGIRLDPTAGVGRLQVEGEIHPGNSGGPVLDSAGTVIGITVAKFVGTNTGLIIPKGELEEMMMGKAIRLEAVEETSCTNGALTVKAKVRVSDPVRSLKEVCVLLTPSEKVPTRPKPDAKGSWGPIPGVLEPVTLAISGDIAEGSVVLTDPRRAETGFLVQVKYVRGDGQAVYLPPLDIRLDFSGKSLLPDPPRKGGPDLDFENLEVKPESSGRSLAGASRPILDARCWDLGDLQAYLILDMALSSDGTSLYVLEKKGTIRLITLPDFTEQVILTLWRECSSLGISKAGLVVASKDLGEILVLDPNTLKLRKRVHIGHPKPGEDFRLLASPSTSRVFVSKENEDLIRVDLPDGTVTHVSVGELVSKQWGKIRKHPTSIQMSGRQVTQLTADGMYLLCSCHWSGHTEPLRERV